jgi:hypothetical protein
VPSLGQTPTIPMVRCYNMVTQALKDEDTADV